MIKIYNTKDLGNEIIYGNNIEYSGNYIICGNKDEMNTLKYQLYMLDYNTDGHIMDLIEYLTDECDSFEQLELTEKQLISLYYLLEIFEYKNEIAFKQNNDKLKDVLIKNKMVSRFLAIEKLKNNIKVK